MVSRPGARPGTRQSYRGPVRNQHSRRGDNGTRLSSQDQNANRETAPPGSSDAGSLERLVRLRIICKAPPDPVQHAANFGLQDKSAAAHWKLQAGIRKGNGDFVFDCDARVRPILRTGKPNFLGDFVHGKPDERFLYLSWRPKDCRPVQPAMQFSSWTRRMKIHLSGITWQQIEEATQAGGVLEASVQGTGKDGGPNCASVPLLGGGWTVRIPEQRTRH